VARKEKTDMTVEVINENGIGVAVVNSNEVLIKDVQSALDLMMNVLYNNRCERIVINKEAICEEFFDLSTRIAGEILQKFVNYHIKIAIVGDFSKYTSKSLKNFIYESNNGKHVFFLPDEMQAVQKISSV